MSARLPTDELGDLFGIELEDDDVDSVGGLLTKVLGRLPEPGCERRPSLGLILTAERTEGRRQAAEHASSSSATRRSSTRKRPSRTGKDA